MPRNGSGIERWTMYRCPKHGPTSGRLCGKQRDSDPDRHVCTWCGEISEPVVLVEETTALPGNLASSEGE